MSADSILGVSLEQRAGVAAAVAERFPLERVLDAEQIDPAGWRAADVGWRQRLAKDGLAGGSTFNAYRAKLEEAEDCLSRAVTPLDDDLGAWLSFLDQWAKSGDPSAMLKKHSLGMNDVSRLRRRWQKRMDAEPKLALEAAKRAANGAGPLPPISVAPANLKPYPWSKRRPAAAAAPVVALRPADSALADDFPLDRYARLSADHRARLDTVHQATVAGPRAQRVAWLEHAPMIVERLAQPLTENVEETGWILAVISDDVLPFQDDPHKPPPPLARLGPSPDVGATSDAIPILRDDARACFDISSDVGNIDETAVVPALMLDDPLPFAPAAGTPPPPSQADPSERDMSGETSFGDVAALGDLDAPLPFRAPASAATPATGARLFGGLTIQQLAAVAVELSLAAHERPAILARYGLSEQAARRAFGQAIGLFKL